MITPGNPGFFHGKNSRKSYAFYLFIKNIYILIYYNIFYMRFAFQKRADML